MRKPTNLIGLLTSPSAGTLGNAGVLCHPGAGVDVGCVDDEMPVPWFGPRLLALSETGLGLAAALAFVVGALETGLLLVIALVAAGGLRHCVGDGEDRADTQADEQRKNKSHVFPQAGIILASAGTSKMNPELETKDNDIPGASEGLILLLASGVRFDSGAASLAPNYPFFLGIWAQLVRWLLANTGSTLMRRIVSCPLRIGSSVSISIKSARRLVAAVGTSSPFPTPLSRNRLRQPRWHDGQR